MADVPSNLIPTRITQLPLAPVADENSLMMIVYQGNNYQIRVGDLLSVAGVPTTRQVIAGSGLTGGGQLSSNVTLSVAPNGIENSMLSNTGVTPGVYGTATDIPVFTVNSAGRVTAATTVPVAGGGGVPTTREVIAGTGLNGGGPLSSNVTLNANLSNATPLSTDGLGTPGVSTDMSRADHRHPSVNLNDADEVDGLLPLSNGGTARSLVPDEGAIIWCGADGLYVGPVGVAGQMLQSNGTGEYFWVNQDTLDVGQADNLNGGAANKLVYQSAADTTAFVDAPTISNTVLYWDGGSFVWGTVPGTGTVISVGLGMPGEFTVSNSPITVSGTLTAGWAAQTANKVLASPTTGSGAPAFRALVNGDLPATISGKTIDTATITNSTAALTLLDVDNIRVDGNTISSTDTNGDINLTPNGTGSVVVAKVDINGGTIDGTTIGGTSPADGTFNTLAATTGNITTVNATTVNATTVDTTNLEVTNLKAKDGTAAGSIADTTGIVTLNSSVLTTTDINGGTIDGTTIGGSVAAAGTFTSVDAEYVDFAPALSPLPVDATGRVYYDNNDQFSTLAFQMNGSVVQKIGEEQYFRVKLTAPATKGQVIMFTGTLGSSGGLQGAPATGLTPLQANYILGVAAETGTTNGWIFVTSFGEVKGINTTGGAEAWTQGQELYYNPAVTGGLTKNKPTAPNAIATVAAVVNVGTSNGILFVRPTFGSVLGGTDGNVQFGTLNNGDVIVYNTGTSRWENVAQSTLSVGSATSATTATNIAGGAAGSIPYQTGSGTTAMLATSSGVLVGGTTPSYSTAPALTGTNFSAIPNAALTNSSITLGTTAVSLGATTLTLGGLTSVAVTQDPTTALQVATKQYVDGLVSSGITYHTPVKYEVPNSTGNLNATYNNGTAGVGATLTNAGTLAAFAPDGPTAQVGDRILIYNQTNQFENGVYEVTTVGDGSTAWVLTRTTDADSYGLKSPNALGEGDAFFITSGNTGAGETYVCNTSGTITFGTTAITFVQVSSSQVYSAGTGLTLTGTQFSLTTPVAPTNGGTGITGYAVGDLVFANTTTSLDRLPIGASSRILTSNGTAPVWTDPSGITVGSATSATSATTATNIAGGAAGSLPYQTGAGTTNLLALGATGYVLVAGASAPEYVAQSTLSVGSASTANSATTATTATNIAGGAAGSIAYNTGTNATSFLALGTTDYVLKAGASAPEYVAQSTLSVGSATNLAGGAASQIPYQTGAGTTAFLANGTAGQVLLSNGASAPSWGGVSGGTF